MNLFDLSAKISLDSKEFDSGINNASKKFEGIAGKFKSGIAVTGKVIGATVGAVATGIATITGMAVKNYAEYEQLVGGVDTLFKNASSTVQKYASEAYKTAGMSANDYMANVTSFSASLLQSLGGDTQKAGDYANQAMIDMSDNANKMGTSIDSIVMTYQSLSRGNFAMLDNLKLGYGGTKEELKRLIADASLLDDSVKANDMSFANITKAIHAVQTEMGITGTTALEASTTIEGSVNSMKGAWQNLLTGVADDNADFEGLVGNFVESVGTVAQNVIPRVQTALQGAGKLVEQLVPVVIDEIPNFVKNTLPEIAESGLDIVEALVDGISENHETIIDSALDIITELGLGLVENLPTLVETSFQILTALANGLVENIPIIMPQLTQVIIDIAMALTNPDSLSMVIDASIELIMALANGLVEALPVLLEKAPEIVQNLVDALVENYPKFMDTAFTLITTLAKGIIQSLPELLSSAWEIVKTLVKGIGDLLSNIYEKGKEIVGKVTSGIAEKFSDLKEKGSEVVQKVKDGLTEKIEEAKTWGKDLIDNFITGIKNKWEDLKSSVSETAESIKAYLGFSEPEKGPLSNFHTYAPDMIDLFTKGIKDNDYKITDQIEKSFDFGEKTISANYNVSGGSTINSRPNFTVELKVDDTKAMGFARALLPLLKVAESEAY